MKKLILFFSIVFLTLTGIAQDKILLIGGKTISAEVNTVDTLTGQIFYTLTKKDKTTPKVMQSYQVFSITNSTGQENILYYKDTLIGNNFSVPDMRKFIIGEQEAMSGYKTGRVFFSAFALSLGISLLDTYKFKTSDPDVPYGFFHSEPSVLQLASPMVFTILAGLPKITINVGNVKHQEHIDDQYFAWGYGKVGRSKRVFAALKGSIAGSLTGMISYYAFRP